MRDLESVRVRPSASRVCVPVSRVPRLVSSRWVIQWMDFFPHRLSSYIYAALQHGRRLRYSRIKIECGTWLAWPQVSTRGRIWFLFELYTLRA